MWQNTDFLPENLAKYRFFQEWESVFLILSLVIQILFLKYWFSLSFIYTGFVLNDSGRSARDFLQFNVTGAKQKGNTESWSEFYDHSCI